MRGQDQSRPFAQRIFNGRQSLSDTRVIGHAAIIREWNIEIHAHENALTIQVQVLYGELRRFN
jgi:hypothetical protein